MRNQIVNSWPQTVVSKRTDTSACRLTLICLTAVILALQYGCATTVVRSVPSKAVRDSFGVIAIVPAEYAPQSKFAISWRHREGATAKQAAREAGGWTATTAVMAATAAPIAVPLAVLGGVAAMVTGTVQAAMETPKGIVPKETAEKIEAAISGAISGQDVQRALAGQLATMLKSDPRVRLATVSAAGPDQPTARPDYTQLRNAGIDTVIEIAINEIGFDGCIANNRECQPPHTLHLFLHGQARMVRVADGASLYEWPLDYNSGPHELTRWLADDGRLLGEELNLAYRELAERIYDEAYLITPIALPFVQNAWRDRCWLEPLYPEHELFHGDRVETLRPALRWTSFPREIDRQQLDPAVLQKISDVTYDLRIWDEDVDQNSRDRFITEQWRNRLIYERIGLAAPQHTLEVPLTPASRYYWSVRARFVVDGRPMVTRWMRRSKCFSYDLSLGYYEFKTPK